MPILEKKAVCKNINDILKTLNKREEKVIRERFGFDNGEEKTLEEIGQDMNITRERVRQIEKKALQKFSHPSKMKQIRNIL